MFENKFTITKDIIKEYQLSYWLHRKFTIGIIILTLLVCILSSFWIRYFFLFDIGLIILVFSMFYVRIRREINMEYGRYQTIYKKNKISAHYRFDQMITIINDVNHHENKVELDLIERMYDTKHLFVLLLKGNLLVPVKKDSFVTGSADEFKMYIKKIITKA